ncbi:hypothetical protein CIK75_02950 [Glutamicibacter sp. BW78]|nr:hypothetical protein CIK75_02950 [Glutamicibacter sp. BW78]
MTISWVSSMMRSQRGSQSVSMIYIAPVLALLLGVLYFAGTVAQGEGIVQSAANAAARDASLARNAHSASRAGRDAAARVLDQHGISCKNQQVSIDAAALNSPVGTSGAVQARVTCDLVLADFGIPELTEKTVTANGMSPVDRYRQR